MKLFVFYCRLLIGVAVLLLSSCYTNRPQRINCRGHEIKQYYSNHTSPDTILIYGRIKLCETGKASSYAKLIFNSKGGKTYYARADKRGHYKLEMEERYFNGKVIVTSGENRPFAKFTIEDVFLGYGNTFEVNVSLYNYATFLNAMELPKEAIMEIMDNKKSQ